MGILKRSDIKFPLSALDVKNLNDMIRGLFFKVAKSVDFLDLSSDTQSIINSKKALFAAPDVGMNAGITSFYQNEFPADIWNAITSNKAVMQVVITTVQPSAGYDFVERHSVFVTYNSVSNAVEIEVVITSKSINGATDANGYVAGSLLVFV